MKIISINLISFSYFIQKKSSTDEDDFGFSTKLKISTEEEDTQALCEMRGVGKNAPLALQLKAIDEEYHYLLDQGQSDKADYVQKLYALKSQQLSKVMFRGSHHTCHLSLAGHVTHVMPSCTEL